MPLIDPGTLREKILFIASAGGGKTTAALSIAWWAFVSGDKRKFYWLDTDDEAVLHVMNEPKYDGMLHSVNGEVVNEGGNVIVWSAYEWPEYQRFSNQMTWDTSIAAKAKPGDWIVIDFITHAWTAAQEGFLHDAANRTRGDVLYQAGAAGKSGWEMFSEDFNWNAINGSYYDFIKPMLLRSRAHVFMTAEEEVIQENAKNLTPDAKEHLAQFGKYKAVGQKKLPYQCRSYLRTQRLARGRVLFTLKDRARQEFNGETITPDFFGFYLKGAAGWGVSDSE